MRPSASAQRFPLCLHRRTFPPLHSYRLGYYPRLRRMELQCSSPLPLTRLLRLLRRGATVEEVQAAYEWVAAEAVDAAQAVRVLVAAAAASSAGLCRPRWSGRVSLYSTPSLT